MKTLSCKIEVWCVAAILFLGGTTNVHASQKLTRGQEPSIHVWLGETSGVVTLPLEEYLRGVVPSEIGADAPAEAKCAQAVAARSFAAVALASSSRSHPGADVCATVHCQVFSGLRKATAATDTAITATRGQIITFEGKPISAFYAAHCGGHTEDIRNSWPDRASHRAYHDIARLDGPGSSTLDLTRDADFEKWLASSPESYCNPEKSKVLAWAGRNLRWQREISADDLTTFVAKKKDIGRVVAMRGSKRGQSGRLGTLELVGTSGILEVGPQIEIRQLFHPMLKSSAFVIEAHGPAERPTHFTLRGAGSGHAVGMCQTGAMGMANAGKSFTEILKHYYPKAAIDKLY